MAKKPEGKPNEEKVEEIPAEEVKKVEAKVEAKVEEANKEIKEVTGKRENIINYVPAPRTDDPDFDFKSWAKALDTKLDTLLAGHKSKEDPKPDDKTKSPEEIKKETPKVHWLDKEFI
jgi:hypothetical protein